MEQEEKVRGAICFIMFLAVVAGVILRIMGANKK
jgi:hypothetical protein